MAAERGQKWVGHALDNDAVDRRFRYFSGAVGTGVLPPDWLPPD